MRRLHESENTMAMFANMTFLRFVARAVIYNNFITPTETTH